MDTETIASHTRFEHIDGETSTGRARLLVKRRYDVSNLSGATYGLDWWRNPEETKKNIMRRLLDALTTSSNV